MSAKQSKVIILGDTGVGKTSTLIRFFNNTFDDNQIPSFGVAFKTKDVKLENGTTQRLNIWDTAGQEKYNALTKMHFRGAEAAVIMYDITDDSSFEKAQFWVDELNQHQQESTDMTQSENQKVLMYLVGNKCDCVAQ